MWIFQLHFQWNPCGTAAVMMYDFFLILFLSGHIRCFSLKLITSSTCCIPHLAVAPHQVSQQSGMTANWAIRTTCWVLTQCCWDLVRWNNVGNCEPCVKLKIPVLLYSVSALNGMPLMFVFIYMQTLYKLRLEGEWFVDGTSVMMITAQFNQIESSFKVASISLSKSNELSLQADTLAREIMFSYRNHNRTSSSTQWMCCVTPRDEHLKRPCRPYSRLVYRQSALKASENRSGASERTFTLWWSETSCTVCPLTQRTDAQKSCCSSSHLFILANVFFLLFMWLKSALKLLLTFSWSNFQGTVPVFFFFSFRINLSCIRQNFLNLKYLMMVISNQKQLRLYYFLIGCYLLSCVIYA